MQEHNDCDVEVDYQYEIQKKNQEIEALRNEITEIKKICRQQNNEMLKEIEGLKQDIRELRKKSGITDKNKYYDDDPLDLL